MTLVEEQSQCGEARAKRAYISCYIKSQKGFSLFKGHGCPLKTFTISMTHFIIFPEKISVL
jgi:hypothetical protein